MHDANITSVMVNNTHRSVLIMRYKQLKFVFSNLLIE